MAHCVIAGGMWLVGDVGVAHFLVDDGQRARDTLEQGGMTVAASEISRAWIAQRVPAR